MAIRPVECPYRNEARHSILLDCYLDLAARIIIWRYQTIRILPSSFRFLKSELLFFQMNLVMILFRQTLMFIAPGLRSHTYYILPLRSQNLIKLANELPVSSQ